MFNQLICLDYKYLFFFIIIFIFIYFSVTIFLRGLTPEKTIDNFCDLEMYENQNIYLRYDKSINKTYYFSLRNKNNSHLFEENKDKKFFKRALLLDFKNNDIICNLAKDDKLNCYKLFNSSNNFINIKFEQRNTGHVLKFNKKNINYYISECSQQYNQDYIYLCFSKDISKAIVFIIEIIKKRKKVIKKPKTPDITEKSVRTSLESLYSLKSVQSNNSILSIPGAGIILEDSFEQWN